MLKLPEPNLTYKGEDARNFPRGKNNAIELLQEYLQDPTTMSEDLSRIQVSSLNDHYREIAWLFTRVTGQDSIATILQLALYILYSQFMRMLFLIGQRSYRMKFQHKREKVLYGILSFFLLSRIVIF